MTPSALLRDLALRRSDRHPCGMGSAECGMPVGAGFWGSGFMVGCENNFEVLLGARGCWCLLLFWVSESEDRVRGPQFENERPAAAGWRGAVGLSFSIV